MISRIPLRCLACRHLTTARVQVGHELTQNVAAVCPECFTPFRLRLLLDRPPEVRVEFVENCEPTEAEGRALNIGAGFVISRARMHEEQYFPALELPRPSPEEERQIQGLQHPERSGPVFVDMTVLLGGLPRATELWRLLKNAYRFFRTGQEERMRVLLLELFGDEVVDDQRTIESAITSFLVRVLKPFGEVGILRVRNEIMRIRALYPVNFGEFLTVFRPLAIERMDEYLELFDHFFRSYDEFNQAFFYVRRSLQLPDDPYAPSVDFESTKLYYGEAFEVLGSNIDVLVALNNVSEGRSFDRLRTISLQRFRGTSKGGRATAVAANLELAWLVGEYDNGLRNASHHRWLRLSHDRSVLSYREGGNGELVRLSYADYLRRCCAITSHLMVLAALEVLLFLDQS
jgi:hypothetical protein